MKTLPSPAYLFASVLAQGLTGWDRDKSPAALPVAAALPHLGPPPPPEAQK
jgi:hypothetical protein